MRRPWTTLLALALALPAVLASGCVKEYASPPETPDPAFEEPRVVPHACYPQGLAAEDYEWDTMPRYEGSARFALEPSAPVLVPGKPLTLRATFTNSDDRHFCIYSGCNGIDLQVIRVGRYPLVFRENVGRNEFGGAPSIEGAPVIPSYQVCAALVRYHVLAPGETVSANLTWDGSLRINNATSGHIDPRTFWAASGEWPLAIGFQTSTSYPVAFETTLRVLENELNRDSWIHPDRCGSVAELLEGC